MSLTDVSPEVLAMLLGGDPASPAVPTFHVEFSYRRAGRAGLTRTQRLLAFERGPAIPVWVWRMRRERPSMRNATWVRTVIPNARLAP